MHDRTGLVRAPEPHGYPIGGVVVGITRISKQGQDLGADRSDPRYIEEKNFFFIDLAFTVPARTLSDSDCSK